MIRLQNISLAPGNDTEQTLRSAAAKRLGIPGGTLPPVHIFRRSVDARKKSDVRIIYTVDVELDYSEAFSGRRDIAEAEYSSYIPPKAEKNPEKRPVVVGFGPAGMFAALILAEAGLRPIVLERGEDADTRTERVKAFWETGKLDTECNVQFGEGGAGTFSDGKLATGVNDARIPFVLETLVSAGAPERIKWDAKPHVGTDILRNTVKNIRKRVIDAGGEVIFGARFTGIATENRSISAVKAVIGGEATVIPASSVILAIGHSARDTFEALLSSGVAMAPKPFAMGVRIEHSQRSIDEAQYGGFAGVKSLGAADYKLSCHTAAGSAYTFCMCPGGYVAAAASEEGRVVTNGMSYSVRAGKNANSALLVGLTPEDFPYSGALGGVKWQRELEQRAFELAGGGFFAPCETVGDFLGKSASSSVEPTYRPGVRAADLKELLPRKITDTLTLALPELGRKLRGFDSPCALLTGPETRSSSPVRILRGDDMQAVGIRGLYPAGEGAGYAGGITSAAVDGIRAAESVILH